MRRDRWNCCGHPPRIENYDVYPGCSCKESRLESVLSDYGARCFVPCVLIRAEELRRLREGVPMNEPWAERRQYAELGARDLSPQRRHERRATVGSPYDDGIDASRGRAQEKSFTDRQRRGSNIYPPDVGRQRTLLAWARVPRRVSCRRAGRSAKQGDSERDGNECTRETAAGCGSHSGQ